MASDAFKQKLLAQAKTLHAAALADKQQAKKKSLQNYVRASTGSAQHAQTVANYGGDLAAARKVIAKRNAGQARAQARLSKLGESDVCPVCGQTPCNCTHIAEATVDDHIKKVVNIYSKHRSLEDRASYKRDKVARDIHRAGAKKASALLDKMRAKQSAANADKPKPTADAPRNYSAAIAQDYKDQEARRGVGHVRDSVELEGTMVEAKSSVPGISGERKTAVMHAIRRAQKTPEQVAKTTYGVGYRTEAREADYGPAYQSLVLRVKQKAKEQEAKKPVDIQSLARRLAAVPKNDKGSSK